MIINFKYPEVSRFISYYNSKLNFTFSYHQNFMQFISVEANQHPNIYDSIGIFLSSETIEVTYKFPKSKFSTYKNLIF